MPYLFLFLFITTVTIGFIQRRRGKVKPISKKKQIFLALWAGFGFVIVVLPGTSYIINNVLQLNADKNFVTLVSIGFFLLWMMFGNFLYQYFVEKQVERKELLNWLLWTVGWFGIAALYYYFKLSGK
jgi:hypothetical protein